MGQIPIFIYSLIIVHLYVQFFSPQDQQQCLAQSNNSVVIYELINIWMATQNLTLSHWGTVLFFLFYPYLLFPCFHKFHNLCHLLTIARLETLHKLFVFLSTFFLENCTTYNISTPPKNTSRKVILKFFSLALASPMQPKSIVWWHLYADIPPASLSLSSAPPP